jgi:hypothetical protein
MRLFLLLVHARVRVQGLNDELRGLVNVVRLPGRPLLPIHELDSADQPEQPRREGQMARIDARGTLHSARSPSGARLETVGILGRAPLISALAV